MLKINQAKLKKKLFFLGLALFFCLTTGFSWPRGYSWNSWWNRHKPIQRNRPPQVGSISPSSGYSVSGRNVSFITTYFDADGYRNLADCRLLINTSLNIKNSFCARYDQNTNKLYLINDNGSSWQGGFAPGSKRVIQNSFCKLDCSKTKVRGWKNTLIINWSISFKSSFIGGKNTYLYARDDRSAVKSWTRRGIWTINPAPDKTRPTGSIKINNNAQYTNSIVVTLNLSAQDNTGGSGLSHMRFSHNNSTWSTPEVYAMTKKWTLRSGDGTKNVYARFKDKAGNWSNTCFGSIVLDTQSPTGSILINNGDESTESCDVTLTLSATDSGSGMGTGSQMQFSNDNSNWSTPEDYATTKSWTLVSDFGTKTVYAKFKDAAGNWSNSVSDTINVVNASPPKERIYIYLNGQRVAMEENGKKFFYHNDHLGGTNVVTDESGAQVKYLDYQPFGETKVEEGDLAVKKKFTGKELDEETGLYDYSARQYDAKLGRFISPDPLEFNEDEIKAETGYSLQVFLTNPQKLNRYSYCLNNPLKYIDPTGRDVVGLHGALRGTPGSIRAAVESVSAIFPNLSISYIDWRPPRQEIGIGKFKTGWQPYPMSASEAANQVSNYIHQQLPRVYVGHSRGAEGILQGLRSGTINADINTKIVILGATVGEIKKSLPQLGKCGAVLIIAGKDDYRLGNRTYGSISKLKLPENVKLEQIGGGHGGMANSQEAAKIINKHKDWLRK